MIHHQFLHVHAVSEGVVRESHVVAFARPGIDAGGIGGVGGRSLHGRIDVVGTAAQIVGADDEILVRVDGFSGAYETAPPAGLFRGIIGVIAAAMGVAGQGVDDQDGVVFFLVERSEGLVDHVQFGKAVAVFQDIRAPHVQNLLLHDHSGSVVPDARADAGILPVSRSNLFFFLGCHLKKMVRC